MTREEAIRCLSVNSSTNGSGLCTDEQHYEAKQMAIEALELQQDYNKGFEDCRQAVLDIVNNPLNIRLDEIIKKLQPVTPQPKTVLYSGDGYADGYMVYDMAECPNCGYEYEDGDKDWGLSFCPNCGQALDWESEGKK